MQNYDYVILFDENGQPYIAHSVWGRVKSGAKKVAGRAASAGKTAHKYLLKVGEGAKARYAYTKEEVDALMGRGRKTAGEAVEKGKSAVKSAAKSGREALKYASTKTREKARDLIGYDERERVKIAEKRVEQTSDAAKKASDRTERAFQQEMSSSPISSRREDRGVSKDKAEKAWWNAAFAQQTAESDAMDAKRNFSEAWREYRKTPLYRLEIAKEDLTSAFDAIKSYGKTAVDKIKDVAGFDERDARDAARRAYAEANDRAHVARDEAWDNLGSRIDTSSEKSRDAWKDFEKARSEYMKTPLGKIEYTAERAKEILTGQDGTPKEIAEDLAERAKDKASEVADRVKDAAKKASDTVKDKASEVADRAKDAVSSIKDQVKQIDPRVKVSGNKLQLPDGKEIKIPEVFIKEQYIPESFINEIMIEEKKK